MGDHIAVAGERVGSLGPLGYHDCYDQMWKTSISDQTEKFKLMLVTSSRKTKEGASSLSEIFTSSM